MPLHYEIGPVFAKPTGMDDQLPEWTNEEFERFTRRLQAFKENPFSLRPDEFNRCRALHREIAADSAHVESLIEMGIDLETLPAINPKRVELVEWLARHP